MKILQIVTNTGAVFTVGETITEDGSPIDSITYFKHAYNSGHQGDWPAYILRFDGSDVRQVVRASSIDIFVIDPEKKKKDDTIPELPAGPGGAANE
jgi:hypothetical protein